MLRDRETPRRAPWGWDNGHGGKPTHRKSSTIGGDGQHAIQVQKRGRWVTVGKIVTASPLGSVVFAVAYRKQNPTTTVSIRPDVLAHCRQAGAQSWVVRHDLSGRCFALPLGAVETSGWLKTSDGKPEWFVPLSAFDQFDPQKWDYVETVYRLEEQEPEPSPQLGLWGVTDGSRPDHLER